jgi:hypothetical protein
MASSQRCGDLGRISLVFCKTRNMARSIHGFEKKRNKSWSEGTFFGQSRVVEVLVEKINWKHSTSLMVSLGRDLSGKHKQF